MRLKGRRQSKNVEDQRSPAASAMQSNYADRMSRWSHYDGYSEGGSSVEAKGPFKRLSESVDGAIVRVQNKQRARSRRRMN